MSQEEDQQMLTAISARINKEEAAFKKGGHPAVAKIQPANPNQQGAALTAGQQQTASLSGGSAGGNVGISST